MIRFGFLPVSLGIYLVGILMFIVSWSQNGICSASDHILRKQGKEQGDDRAMFENGSTRSSTHPAGGRHPPRKASSVQTHAHRLETFYNKYGRRLGRRQEHRAGSPVLVLRLCSLHGLLLSAPCL